MKKSIFTIIFIIITIIFNCLNISCAAVKDITVKIDGVAIEFPDAKPYLNSDNRTMIPIRFVSEKMGASVNWNGVNRVVTIKQNTKTIELKIGQKTAIVNGKEIVFDTAAIIKDSRTFVPLRFISETLGSRVEWDASTLTVNIYTKPVDTSFIEPIFRVDGDVDKYYPYFFSINLDNAIQYPMNAYMIKVNIDNYPQLNLSEQPNAIYPSGWEEIQLNYWAEVQTGIEEIWTLNKNNYTTRANMKTFKITDGMEIKYTITLKQIKTGIVKDYKGTTIVKIKK